jgi:uncharacterized protein YjiS (DUF1127 family)
MSAPMTKSQMAFELPQLSYIDTLGEEPEFASLSEPAHGLGFAGWIAARVAAFHTWRENAHAVGELRMMSDRELFDVGLNRGDFDRIFDNRYNQDLQLRGRLF